MPLAYAPDTRRLSMIVAVTNKDRTRLRIIAGNFDSDRPIEFLELLIINAEKNMSVILDSLRVHRSKPVETWLEESKENRILLFAQLQF